MSNTLLQLLRAPGNRLADYLGDERLASMYQGARSARTAAAARLGYEETVEPNAVDVLMQGLGAPIGNFMAGFSEPRLLHKDMLDEEGLPDINKVMSPEDLSMLVPGMAGVRMAKIGMSPTAREAVKGAASRGVSGMQGWLSRHSPLTSDQLRKMTPRQIQQKFTELTGSQATRQLPAKGIKERLGLTRRGQPTTPPTSAAPVPATTPAVSTASVPSRAYNLAKRALVPATAFGAGAYYAGRNHEGGAGDEVGDLRSSLAQQRQDQEMERLREQLAAREQTPQGFPIGQLPPEVLQSIMGLQEGLNQPAKRNFLQRLGDVFSATSIGMEGGNPAEYMRSRTERPRTPEQQAMLNLIPQLMMFNATGQGQLTQAQIEQLRAQAQAVREAPSLLQLSPDLFAQ